MFRVRVYGKGLVLGLRFMVRTKVMMLSLAEDQSLHLSGSNKSDIRRPFEVPCHQWVETGVIGVTLDTELLVPRMAAQHISLNLLSVRCKSS